MAALLPVIALLLVLLTIVGRSWQEDRQRADAYRSAQRSLAAGHLIHARETFSRLDGYRDADERASSLDSFLTPLELRTRAAGELVASGQSTAALAELRAIVAQAPDLEEAVHLLEQARLSVVDDAVAEADRHLADGDVVGARWALVAGLRLEQASPALRDRLGELDARHPLLLLTNEGDVAVTEFDGDSPRVIMTGEDASWAV
jgi:hypothetical protein